MKKMLCVVLLFLVGFWPVFSMSIASETEVHPFDSIPMLEGHYDESDDGHLDYWEKCTVSLLTVTRGRPLYSWFGHAAFLVSTPEGRNITYDYGTFSFDEENFFVNFALGRLWFVCLSNYAEYQLESLDEDGRSVTQVVLPLSAEQKKAVIGFLNCNSRQDNRTYLYHHYRDNCATRLRDIIDWTTGGDFKRWAEARKGYTFRQQASRALSNNRLVLWVLDFLQSGAIDREATLWDEMFLPENLEKGVMEYFSLENSLVVDNEGSNPGQPDKPQGNLLFSALLGLVLGGVSCVLLHFRKTEANYIYTAVLDFIFGILGSVLFFMMLFTNHDVTYMNENLIFVNPCLLVLGVLSLIAVRRERMRVAVLWSYRMLSCLIALLCILKLVPGGFFIQQNWSVIVTMALVYLPNTALLKPLSRK